MTCGGVRGQRHDELSGNLSLAQADRDTGASVVIPLRITAVPGSAAGAEPSQRDRHALDCAVKTVAWPTWEGVGMITNFDVTKRYISPMAVDEGVRHWLAELADTRNGEVMFMGEVGRALTPIQIRGFSPVFGLPNIRQLITRQHHAGEPQRFRPFARLLTHYRIDCGSAPFVYAYRLDNSPALPSAILMEHACGVGDWVMPDGGRAFGSGSGRQP